MPRKPKNWGSVIRRIRSRLSHTEAEAQILRENLGRAKRQLALAKRNAETKRKPARRKPKPKLRIAGKTKREPARRPTIRMPKEKAA